MNRTGMKRFVAFAAAACVTVGCVLGFVVPVLASNPPHMAEELYPFDEVYSTRANIALIVNAFEHLELKWRGEYAVAEPGGEPPAANSPAWTLASSGAFTIPPNDSSPLAFMSLGSFEPSTAGGQFKPLEDRFRVLRDLSASTTYYARFRAENPANGNSAESKLFKFKTAPIAKPEVANYVEQKGETTFTAGVTSYHSAQAQAQVETNGAQTEYWYEYAPAEPGGGAPSAGSPAWKVPAGCAGIVTVSEDFADTACSITGLTPETTYYIHLRMENEKGETLATKYGGSAEHETFTTLPAKPEVSREGNPEVRNVTGTSAYLVDTYLNVHSSKTHWRFEYSTSSGGQWSDVPGAEGTVSQAEAEALGEHGVAPGVEGRLSGLDPASTYYVRLFAENAAGEAVVCATENNNQLVCEPLATATGNGRGFAGFRTSGGPSASTFALHTLRGETLRISGSVDPNSVPTSAEQVLTLEGAPTGGSFTLTFNGQRTATIPFDAEAEAVSHALQALAGEPQVTVTGRAGGPYTVFFGGKGVAGVAQSLIEGSGSGLTPSGSVGVVTTQAGGEAYDTHYHFEYESQKDFEANGSHAFAHATSTPVVDLGTGGAVAVGADLPPLTVGETYRYRVSATSTLPGNPVVDGEEQVLRVPAPAPVEPAGSCPNEQFRFGPASALPDCRAYEQITPVDKSGAQEIYNYGGTANTAGAVEGMLAGEDGNHVMFGSTFVHWGTGPTEGQSPYFFTRTSTGWQMTATTAQSQAGIFEYAAQVFDPDLARFGFATRWDTSSGPGAQAQRIEYEVGPPGGPYTTAASVPAAQVGQVGGRNGGWAAASHDFSKLIMRVEDRNLVAGKPTGTNSGFDLYEYAGGGLRQVNVDSRGKTIGTCGANVAKGVEESSIHNDNEQGETPGLVGSENTVSADGSRVFFYAGAPGECPSPEEMEPDRGNVEAGQISGHVNLYMRSDGGGESASTLDIGQYAFLEADAQGSTLLLARGGERFRYDTEKHVAVPVAPGESLSPRRYTYSLGGVPAWEFGTQHDFGTACNATATSVPVCDLQVLRYDSSEHLLECVSCVSSFDPEPRYGATQELATANGDYVFFDTPSALVPSDVDGESLYLAGGNEESLSLSSDVYEWRRDGLHGCASVGGCLSLITTGHGGYLNSLLAVAQEGRDVFFTTHESLLPRDTDTSGDIYDARIGGGFPEPVRPVECEGDACSTPALAPLDATPSSLTFNGAGNLPPEAAPKAKVTKPKSKKKIVKRKRKKKRGKKSNRKAKKSARGRK